MGNDSSSKAIEISTVKVKVKIFNGIVRTLSNGKHVPKLRSSISLRALDILSYDFSTKKKKIGIMNINKGALIAMKKKKLEILYTLIRKTILGKVMKLESHEESSHQNYQDFVIS